MLVWLVSVDELLYEKNYRDKIQTYIEPNLKIARRILPVIILQELFLQETILNNNLRTTRQRNTFKRVSLKTAKCKKEIESRTESRDLTSNPPHSEKRISSSTEIPISNHR